MSGFLKLVYYFASAISAVLAVLYAVFGNTENFDLMWRNVSDSGEYALECLPHWVDSRECRDGSPLELDGNIGGLYPGDALPLHFRSHAPGYLSIWNIDTEGRVACFFPAAGHAPMAVVAGRDYRGGQAPLPEFEVSGGPGTERLVLLFSATAQGHCDVRSYPNSDGFEALLRAHGASPIEWLGSCPLAYPALQAQAQSA